MEDPEMEKSLPVNNIFISDPKLPGDLTKHRSHDSNGLLCRLEAVNKHNTVKTGPIEGLEVKHIQFILKDLVQIYINTIDSVKISRAVEKLWHPYLTKYSEFVCTCFEKHIMNMIEQGTKCQVLTNILLEQNKMVQSVFKQNVGTFIAWLNTELSPLMDTTPSCLTQNQAKSLYLVVKICLQLFQVCPTEVGSSLLGPNVTINPSLEVTGDLGCVKKYLQDILGIQGYQTDCVLLCGTAMALLYNTFPSVSMASYSYFTTLSQILKNGLDDKELSKTGKSFNIALTKVTSSKMGILTLFRGSVACSSPQFLLAKPPAEYAQQIGKENTNSTIFNLLYDYILCLCQGDITLHYHSFEILLLWYTRLTKFNSDEKSLVLETNSTSILKSTIELLFLNWESPVDDVSETVVQVFVLMMSVWSKWRGQLEQWPEQILTILLNAPWYVKGKYRILAALLKYINSEKILLDSPEVRGHLLQCLSTNHLATSATNVYKAFLLELKCANKELYVDKWSKLWLDTVVTGLVSNNSVLRYNTSQHLVPGTLRQLPGCGRCLQGHLSSLIANNKGHDGQISRTRLLYAWVVVNKSIRIHTGEADLFSAIEYISEALYSSDEDVRSEALAFICITLKKAECISPVEVSLLKDSLPYNIKIDSAPFRQHMGSIIRKLLVHLRDSCITLLKNPEKNATTLDRALDFVDWLHSLCIDCLLPGACYQRRRGSLDLLHVIYDCLIYTPNNKQRKQGFTSETSVKLVEFAKRTNRWRFFSEDNMDILIVCVLDSADEIQTSACQLLTKYYNWSLDNNVSTPDGRCCHLLEEGLRLCNSPKGHEGQSGAVLCKLVFKKYVVEQNVGFQFTYDNKLCVYHVTLCETREPGNVANFLSALLHETQRCMTEAEKHLVRASKHYPIHGLVSAMSQCVTDSTEIWTGIDGPRQAVVDIVLELISTCQGIVDKMLGIMACVDGQGACPSFAEIGVALESLLKTDQSDYTETTVTSPQFQYMLSWCWNNIKESCVSLGELTLTLVAKHIPLTLELLHSISDTFTNVLTKCRHKGVIEGCRNAFVKFCSALCSSSDEKLHDIPVQLLDQVLSSLHQNVLSSSVTRRSAGLPIIIQAILVAEKKMKKTSQLTKAVTTLFEIIELPLCEDVGLTDLPQSHGLHILDSVFDDTSLSAGLVGQVGRALIIVIGQFGSPSWAVRNAATRLFSTLVTRIFGQKKLELMLCNPMNLQEFSSYYPELPVYMLDVLHKASTTDVTDISQIHPGLFPVLTLLSCLTPLDVNDQAVIRMLQQFADKLQVFTKSPVYQLRHLVAPSLVAMVNLGAMTTTTLSCIATNIPVTREKNINLNNLHGNLLLVYRLLEYIDNATDIKKIWSALVERSWLITDQICLVSAQYVQILHRLLHKCHDLHLVVKGNCHLGDIILESCCHGDFTQTIGVGVYSKEAVNILYAINRHSGESLCLLVATILSSANQDSRREALKKLQVMVNENDKHIQPHLNKLMRILCTSLPKEHHIPNLCLWFELITSLYHVTDTIHPHDIDSLQDWFQANQQEVRQFTSLGAVVLPVQAILVKYLVQTELTGENIKYIEAWCNVVKDNSHVTNETQRMSSAVSLQVAGQQVLSCFHGNKVEKLDLSIVSLLDACLTLIQDEDSDIRSRSCQFVSSLPRGDSLVNLFLEYISSQCWWSGHCVQYLVKYLYSPGDLASVCQDRLITRFDQLFDQEDNSYYAEKLYNVICLHKYLKVIVSQCLTNHKQASIDCLYKYRDVIHTDLDILISTLGTINEDSIINMTCDSVVLSSICSLVLVADLVAMVTDDSSNRQNMQTKFNTIIQMDVLPAVLCRTFKDNCSLAIS